VRGAITREQLDIIVGMSQDEDKAKRWQVGTRTLFLSLAVLGALLGFIAPSVRSFLRSVQEKVAAAPEIDYQFTPAEVESLPLPTKEIWSLLKEGQLLGRKAEEVEDLFVEATKVDHRNGQTAYQFVVGDRMIDEGTVPLMFLLVGRNGLILRCGTGRVTFID
jgi:hypothetical protein